LLSGRKLVASQHPSTAHQRREKFAMAVVAELPLRASQAEQRLSELRLALDDMRDQRDKWQAQAERLRDLRDKWQAQAERSGALLSRIRYG
jgi:hypothetical protein